VYLSLSDSNLTFLIDYFWVREREREKLQGVRLKQPFWGRAGRFAAGSWAASLFVFFSIKISSRHEKLVHKDTVDCSPSCAGQLPSRNTARSIHSTGQNGSEKGGAHAAGTLCFLGRSSSLVVAGAGKVELFSGADHTCYLPFDSIHSLPRGRVFPHILGVPRAISFSSG
jgi:hypothetical protein